MVGFSFLAAQVALTAWRDGFSEGLNGMLAVAFTLRNRKNAGFHGGDWAQVLSHHREYSSTIEPYSDEVPNPNVYAVQLLLQEIDGIMSGARQDNVTISQDPISNYISVGAPPPLALYYGRLDQISNPWFMENICRRPDLHKRIATVGLLSFFS